MTKIIIGLTGAIVKGKILMLKHFRFLGYKIFDTDYKFNSIYENPPQELIEICNETIIDNKINKTTLHKLIINNNNLLRK